MAYGPFLLRAAASHQEIAAGALSGWPTPTGSDQTGGRTHAQVLEARAKGHGVSNLNATARLAIHGWPTPNAGPQNDSDTRWRERRKECLAKRNNGNGFGLTLGMAVQMTEAGTPRSERRAQLNPAFPR